MVRFPERRSRPARWSRRLAIFTIPLIVLTALLHRFGGLETTTALFLLGLSLVLALAALILGLAALGIIWWRGDTGVEPAVVGVVLSVLVLAWPAWQLTALATLPRINDVTTDGRNPPRLDAAARDRPDSANDTRYAGMSVLSQQAAAYPEIVPFFLSYPAGQVFEAASALAAARGWRELVSVPPEFGAPGRIEAVARTPLFGFEDDVAIRITPQAGEETRIDMRSASRYGRHDLGANAARIYSFLSDLQTLLDTPPEPPDGELLE